MNEDSECWRLRRKTRFPRFGYWIKIYLEYNVLIQPVHGHLWASVN